MVRISDPCMVSPSARNNLKGNATSQGNRIPPICSKLCGIFTDDTQKKSARDIRPAFMNGISDV